MTNSRIKPKLRTSPEAEKIVAEAIALSVSGSRLEDDFWESKLSERITRLLKSQNQSVIDAALDQTFKINLPAFEYLADTVETIAESMCYEFNDGKWDVLFIALPIIGQTKYSIPSGAISANHVERLISSLHRFIVSQSACLSVIPWLYSIDQMPQSHSQTRQLLEKMAVAAVQNIDLKIELKGLPETISVLADPRFILACIAVPHGAALFRWQEEDSRCLERSQALKEWTQDLRPVFAELMPGCEFELLLPDAYFTNCREADKRVRPLSLKAAVNYLTTSLGVDSSQLSCVVGAFGEEIADEFRISFSIRGHSEIIYGVVWPLYDRETVSVDQLDDSSDEGGALKIICDTLKSMGIQEIFKHAVLFEPELCEDCGVPLFPDRIAEVVHAEMPEDIPAQSPLFH